jgi:hypothetical protein
MLSHMGSVVERRVVLGVHGVQRDAHQRRLDHRLVGEGGVPAGLATVYVDRERDMGEHWEPNIWLIHTPRPAT